MRLAATTLVFGALLAAGCGADEEEGEPIPAGDAQALLTQLDQTQQLVDDGTCRGARFQVTGDDQLEDKVAALPEDVNPDVRQALEDGLDRLGDLIDQECGEDEEPETDTTETEPEVPTETQEPEEDDDEETETEPPPTETEPPPTETQPPPTETVPEVPPVPPSEGGGVPPDGDSE